MAALVLKQIERGTASLGATDVTLTVTLTTPLTNMSSALIFCSLKCNSNNPFNYGVNGSIISNTQIQFDRYNNPPNVAVEVEYQVVEFKQGIFVQHLVVNQNANSKNTTIIGTDLTRSFVIGTNRNSGTAIGADDLVAYDLNTESNLNTVSQANNTNLFVAIQVVQIDDATVQKISTTGWGSGATLDITVSTIDPAKTFWFFGLTDNTGFNCDQWPYLSYVNSTTLRFTKNFSGPWGSKNTITYVVSLSSGVTVQNISTVIASGAASVSPAITTVTVANTALSICGVYQRLVSTSEADDNAAGGAYALSGLTTTAFTATRAASPLFTAIGNVQVLEFSTSGTLESWFLKANQNALYQGQNINGMR